LGFPVARPSSGAGGRRHEARRESIDAFLEAARERTGIAPQPEASREILVRRLHLDLVGLPPQPEELAAILADDLPKLRATGFLAHNWFLFNRTPWMDETVEHVAKGFLGLSLSCAKCHDHKYDPLRQEDEGEAARDAVRAKRALVAARAKAWLLDAEAKLAGPTASRARARRRTRRSRRAGGRPVRCSGASSVPSSSADC
jgi:hypothetical protein